MGKKPIVKLRVYRGRTLSYNADGTVQNENQLISVEHNSIQWKLTLKNLPISGYCKVDVEKVFLIGQGNVYKEVEDLTVYLNEVKDALNPKSNLPKTEDQLKIEQLESQNKEMLAKMEAFMNLKTPSKAVEDDSDGGEVTIEDLKAEYLELTGKNPHHMMKEERLIEEIDKIKNK